MKTLALDRSTDTQSAALAVDGKVVASKVFGGADARSSNWPVLVRDFLKANGLEPSGVDRFLVGQGPGSFSGIRAALALAQGLALPKNSATSANSASSAAVFGLPSAIALTRDGAKVAVVGDARRERFWVILYDGTKTVKDFDLVAKDGLAAAVPDGYCVMTPDGARIETLLKAVFPKSYAGSAVPLAARLAEIAEAEPALLKPEPLPIYLQPAVRPVEK